MEYNDTLFMGGVVIYSRGVWATIQKKARETEEVDEELVEKAALAILQGYWHSKNSPHAPDYDDDDIWRHARSFAKARYEKTDDIIPGNSRGMGSDDDHDDDQRGTDYRTRD